MDKLIPTINKLQELFAQVNIQEKVELPQIVVVGAQSTGKSSVLESIVGRDFLPRGSGIVTRTPIILQLIHSSSKENLENGKKAPQNEYAEFMHKPDQRFVDFNAVREEVEKQTMRTAGSDKEISNNPIILKIHSPNVLDLTLVDLPGLTKVPVGGQPKDIEKMVRQLVKEYIKNPKSIILAVSAANIDIANSDSLQLSREVDPNGDRTLGVITKFDIMDKGTNALNMLLGKDYPLKLGYVGVVCRSQQDLTQKKELADAKKSEKEFFENNAVYKAVKKDCGIDCLTVKLNQLLRTHINSYIPTLKDAIQSRLNYEKEELNTCGESIENKEAIQRTELLNLLRKYSEHYTSRIEGKILSSDKKNTGANIRSIFNNIYSKKLNSMTPYDEQSDEEIKTTILNSNPLKPSLFIPEGAFEILIRQQIKKLLEPSIDCAKEVFFELIEVARNPEISVLNRFDYLKNEIIAIITSLLGDHMERTEEMIKNIIEIEEGYINVDHPEIQEKKKAIMSRIDNEKVREQKEPQKMDINPNATAMITNSYLPLRQNIEITKQNNGKTPEVSKKKEKSREDLEIEIIKQMMDTYFHVLVVRVADIVPKIVISFLVNKPISKIHDILIQKIYIPDKLKSLLEENPAITEKRNNCKKMINLLTESQKILNDIQISHS